MKSLLSNHSYSLKIESVVLIHSGIYFCSFICPRKISSGVFLKALLEGRGSRLVTEELNGLYWSGAGWFDKPSLPQLSHVGCWA